MRRSIPQSRFHKNGTMVWTGKTLKEATAKRDETLDRLFDERNPPEPVTVIAYGVLGTVFRQNDGWWAHSIKDIPKGPVAQVQAATCYTGPERNRVQAEMHMRRHLAQRVFNIDAGVDGLDVIMLGDSEGYKEHERWCAWQKGYRQLKDEDPKRSDGEIRELLRQRGL